MMHATFAVLTSPNITREIAPLLLFLLFLCVVFIWDRRTRRRRKPYVLIRIQAGPADSTTRPSLMDPEGETVARRIGSMIESAGLGPIKVLLFQGKPTTDLIVEAIDPDRTAAQIQTLLEGLPVTVSSVGRPGDLTWHTKLWRHL